MYRYYFEILTKGQEITTGEFTTKVSRKGKVKKLLLEKQGLKESECLTFVLERVHGDN